MKNASIAPSPMTASHDASSKPSILLVLLCLTVVHRFRPEWISIRLEEAARSETVNPQRLSRLCSRAMVPFQSTLDLLTRIGRPQREKRGDSLHVENGLLSSLLGVTTALLRHVSFRKPAIRALVAGAYLRLKATHPELTKERFCQTLSLSPRTFRYWMAHKDEKTPSAPVASTPPKRPPRKRPPRRPRFGFDVVLPDTQVAADTTDLKAFGVPLKLVAAQDVGGRDQDLFDSIIIDTRESADHVVRAVTEALGTKEGQQVLTDQGTPYMAEATSKAIDDFGAEHAPQKEGDPIGKATIERAFGTVKQIAGPILQLTSQIAAKLPELNNTDLAKAAATLLLTALLRAYQAGARAARRADEQRASVSRDELKDLSEKSRENARAENRSVRLFLTHLHSDYDIKRTLTVFIRKMRRFPLQVLKEAERAFAAQVHRNDIKDRASYFAAITRRCYERYLTKREKEKRQQTQEQQQKHDLELAESIYASHRDNPDEWLRDALDALAAQWIPERNTLLFGGAGLGKRNLIDAIACLADIHNAQIAQDVAIGVFQKFEIDDPKSIGTNGLCAIRRLLDAALEKQLKNQSDCKLSFAPAILRNNGP
jgi:hypothetical protein